jgi:hypothetical protein
MQLLSHAMIFDWVLVFFRTQFSKDDVESFDSPGYWIVDNDVDGDDGIWVDLAVK